MDEDEEIHHIGADDATSGDDAASVVLKRATVMQIELIPISPSESSGTVERTKEEETFRARI